MLLLGNNKKLNTFALVLTFPTVVWPIITFALIDKPAIPGYWLFTETNLACSYPEFYILVMERPQQAFAFQAKGVFLERING